MIVVVVVIEALYPFEIEPNEVSYNVVSCSCGCDCDCGLLSLVLFP